MEVLHDPPSHSDYTPLSEHQSQTPASFYDGPAILHHHCSSCTLTISKHELGTATAFAGLASGAKSIANGQVNGHSDGQLPNGESINDEERVVDPEVEILNVDVWVTSERFLLYYPTQHSGVSIPYPSISLHAIQRTTTTTTTNNTQSASLFLQILPQASATFDDHDPDETISLYITPPPPPSSTSTSSASTSTSIDPTTTTTDETTALYTALSTCANLHPDPSPDDDEEDFPIDDFDNGIISLNDSDACASANGHSSHQQRDALPPPMPGSGGWITAENVGEFFDGEGNFRGRGGGSGTLGEGAGRVRGWGDRDGDGGAEGEEGEGGDGEGEGAAEAEGEVKWSRTG